MLEIGGQEYVDEYAQSVKKRRGSGARAKA
jgi:hypothetical protein